MTVKLVFDLTCLIKKEIDHFRKYKTEETLKLTPECVKKIPTHFEQKNKE